MDNVDQKIRQFVYRVRARLREQQIVDDLLKAVSIGLGLAILVLAVSLFVAFYYAVPLAVCLVTGAFLVGLISGIRHTPTPMEAALRADAKGHKEKISTAFYLKGREDAFSMLQKRDAVKITESFSIRKAFPLKIPVKRGLAVIGLAVLFVVTGLIDTPARDRAVARHEVRQEVKKEIAKIEKVEKEIKEKKEISEAEAKAVGEQLETAKKELSEAQSKGEIKKAKERMLKKMEMAGEKAENKTLGEVLNEAVQEAREQETEKQTELAKEAFEAMEQAEKGSSRDKKKAYEKLEELAQAMDDQALQEAAGKYKKSDYSDGDYAAAKNALNQTMDRMNNGNTDLANQTNQNGKQNTSGQNNSQNGQSNTNQNQNSNRQHDGNNQNAQGNSGQNTSGQNGNNRGEGQGEQQGSGAGGSGSGSGAGWNKGSKDGKEGAGKTNENITIPDGEVGNDDDLTGKANGNDSSTKTKSNQSKTWSGNKVSYGSVSGTYKKKAYKKIDGSSYPEKMKNKIKNYFDGLN